MQQQTKEWFSTSINEQEKPIHSAHTHLKKANQPINEDTLIKLLNSYLHGQLASTPSNVDTISFSDTLEQVKKELKELQEQSEGRVRLQYAILEGNRFYIVGHINDYTYKDSNLYNLQIRIEDLLQPFDWEVGLSVVRPNSKFQTTIPLFEV